MGYDRVVERAHEMDAEARANRRRVEHWRMSLDMWLGLGEFSRHKAVDYRRPTESTVGILLGHDIWVDENLPPNSLTLE